jgi:hypothetical protein
MVPEGFVTIPEAIQFIMQEAPDEDAPNTLTQIVEGGHLPLFVEMEGKIYRIPWDDLRLLWRDWWDVMTEGRFPRQPPPEDEDFDEWVAEDYAVGRVELAYYQGVRPLVRLDHLEILFPPKCREPLRSGAPGKPSSMHLVIAEFKRRRSNGGCANSRHAEAEALAKWLAKAHPNAPTLKAKSISTGFQQTFNRT